jgi:uncharacterized iron-regulated membrane protein
MFGISTLWNQPRRHWLRRALFQVHLWIGVALGIFIAIVSISGSIIVFRNEMNRLTTPGTGYVKPEPHRLPLDAILAAVLKNRPGDSLVNVSLEDGPDTAWNIRTKSKEGHRIHNFVDPYRGVVVGVDDYNSKLLQWVWDLHANLLGGKTGRFVNGCLALATVVLSLSGLIIWWPGWRLLRSGFCYSTRRRWQRQNYDLHKVVGFFSFALLAIVSFSGAYFSFPETYEFVTAKLTRVAHVPPPDLCGDDGPPAKTPISKRKIPYEDYMRIAEQQIPGYKTVFVALPTKPGMSVGVKLKGQNDWHRLGLSNVYLEPATGKVIAVDAFSQNSAASKFLKLMLPFHFGRFGGRFGLGTAGVYAVMVAYVLVGLSLGLLVLTGLLMYWNRSFSKKIRPVLLQRAKQSITDSVVANANPADLPSGIHRK